MLGIASTAHADTDQSQSAQGAGEQATADVESNHAAAQIQQSQVALNSQPTSPVTGNQKAANERSAMQNVAKDGQVITVLKHLIRVIIKVVLRILRQR